MEGLTWVAQSFWELSNDRQIGMETGPIPSASIDRWAERHSMPHDDAEIFRTMIRAMDGVYLEFANRDPKDKSAKYAKPAMDMDAFDAMLDKAKGSK